MRVLAPSKSPNLQVPSQQYDPAEQQFLVNQLKLYFIQLDQANTVLTQQAKALSVAQWLGVG
jgi:hypothetical protein